MINVYVARVTTRLMLQARLVGMTQDRCDLHLGLQDEKSIWNQFRKAENQELNNGRLAMMGITGGQSSACQNVPWNAIHMLYMFIYITILYIIYNTHIYIY